MKKFGVTSVQNVPLRVGLKLEEFNKDEGTESWPFRELVEGLMWSAISTHAPIFSTQFDLLRGTVSKTGTWRFMLLGKRMPCSAIFEDNQGAVQLSQNLISNSNPKHVDVRRHFLRELVRQGNISVSHVPSEHKHAGILTKALAFDVFAIHRRFLMNLSV